MLTKKTAVVTGASRGLGLEVCRQLGQADCKVVMVARDATALATAVATLTAEGLDVVGQAADVTDAASVAALGSWVQSTYGGADILVNNAGVFLDPKNPADPASQGVYAADPAVLAQTFAVNVLGPLRMIQTFLPGMVARYYGRVVNVSSGMGSLAESAPYWPAYRISKTALNSLTRTTALEVLIDATSQNVKVNAVCPGWCRTDMGGGDAPRSPADGAASIVWAALLPDDGPTGGFFRDGQPIPW